MDRVKDKIAVVTGAAHGIGRATASLLADEGATVLLADIDRDAALEFQRELQLRNRPAEFIELDVRDESHWQRTADHVRQKHGRLDILVNNAGIYLIKPLAETTPADLENLYRTNELGVFLGMKTFAPLMAERKAGSIVNLSSMDGNVGSWGHVAYGATKGAVRTMSKHAAIEFAKDGVRVNSIHPGYIHTRMAEYAMKVYEESADELGEEFPVGHIGQPLDVAYAVLYLASDESRFVTGAELPVDGGALAK